MAFFGRFEGYTLRDTEQKDSAQLGEWIAADAVHAGVLSPAFFLGEDDGRVTALVLEDRHGPIVYIRIARCARVAIQFPPEPRGKPIPDLFKHRAKLRNALIKGMAFLEVGLSRAGCSEWIFDTQSDNLRRLVTKRMGFAASPNEMKRLIREEN